MGTPADAELVLKPLETFSFLTIRKLFGALDMVGLSTDQRRGVYIAGDSESFATSILLFLRFADEPIVPSIDSNGALRPLVSPTKCCSETRSLVLLAQEAFP